ncbi:Transcriptional regulator ClgR [Corynebacterium pseudotuberculosis]|nr:Transcriptional regulator ClgR [Corynebacterium pseudotuberculosis]ALR33868.1 HTH_3-family transcription regulator [Corynebacterium pseudotuberculosis]ATQ65599.1 Transcriptional regulator ClgR [Corynebacterium pseudotuberculosis]ATQ81535.1 Transcriptional regulator ClgR [Corynebacterium pseudotuberculosis]QBG77467.1 Transcriptional regulator ClgR [Corynebacterium pseudotuberculosis]
MEFLWKVGTKERLKSFELTMMKYTAVLDNPVSASIAGRSARAPEPLLRQALGAALRAFRADKGITLRELAEASRVSPGYLSELERGRKEVSSELLASVCHALGATVADVLIEAAGSMAVRSAEADLARV